MVKLELTAKDQVLLQEALETCLNDLAFAIGDAPDGGYREMLRSREAVLRNVLAQLEKMEDIPPATSFVE